MATQPRWNKIEAAILLEAVLNVENGIETRKNAIVRVSGTLRSIAKAQGVEIDEKYRNVNGITFQFQSMEYSALGRVGSINKTGSKLFDEIVALKKEDPAEYDALLEQANKLSGTNEIKTWSEVNEMSYRAAFRDWLLSLGKSVSIADYMISEFDAISDYAMEKRLSALDIWTISNAKQYVKYMRALQEYKFFRVLQKERYKFFQNHSKLYLTFLKESANYVRENEPTTYDISENEFASAEADKRLQDEFPVETKSIYTVLKEDSRHAYLTVEQIASLAKCGNETAETILTNATWSEKLGNGFVLGSNDKYSAKKSIKFSVEKFYDSNTNEDNILIKDFRRGFRPRSIMDRKRFINLYEEQFGETLSDDEAVSRITARTFAFDGRLFLPKAVVNRDTAESLREYVEDYFTKKDILFYDVLFSSYKEQFNSLIYSPEMLAAFIEHTFIGTPLFFREKYFSYIQSAKPDISSEVIDYLIRMDRPCSYDEIYEALPHLKREDVYSVLHYNSPEILGNSKTEYFHIEVAHIDEREQTILEAYCERLLGSNKYITCNEIIERLPQIDEELYERCESRFTTLGLRRILTYYLRTKFDVMTGVVTRKGEQMSIKEVFIDYAQKHPTFTVDDVQDLAGYTGTVPYWDAIYDNAVRINNKDFVSDEMIDFDIDAIDDAVAFYCEGYMPLAGIVDFMRFPSCGYPWNIYLLQEYVYRFSKVFKLLSLGFTKGSASGVIVKKQLGYNDFDSVLVDVLSKTDITVKQDAMNYLCEQGFITDRRYKKVEELLKKAVVLRKKNSEK